MYLKVRINNLKNGLNFLEGYGNAMQNPNQVVLFFVQIFSQILFFFKIDFATLENLLSESGLNCHEWELAQALRR